MGETRAPPCCPPSFVALATEMRGNREAGELDKFGDLDIAFHSLPLSASGNEVFVARAGYLAWRTIEVGTTL